jgi:tRNA threonylcarbamoyladenosine biosynthesis protein TsaB
MGGPTSNAEHPASRLLAIESATRRASVALLVAGEPVASLEGGDRDHHAERLLPMIDALLTAAKCTLAELTGYAVSIGPGGFTSLRIGLATLKGLAFGSEVPVAAVSTLEALAHTAWAARRAEPEEMVLALLDARRGELYAGGYRRREDGALEPVIEDRVAEPKALAASLEGRVRLVGEGAALLGAEIARLAKRAEVEIDAGPALWPTAASVGALGTLALAAGAGQAAGRLVPRYLRRAQAEETRTAQRFE